METKNKVWTIDEIKALLQKNPVFVAKSTVKIFERQTMDEKLTDSTGNNNGIGFNSVDAFIMSRLAKFYIERGYLSAKQFAIASKKIMKYAKQLTNIANEPKLIKL